MKMGRRRILAAAIDNVFAGKRGKQQLIGDACGLSRNMISMIVAGSYNPNEEHQAAMREALGKWGEADDLFIMEESV